MHGVIRVALSLTLLIATLLTVRPAQATGELTLTGYQEEPFPLYRYQLANGLRVWYQPRTDSTSVTLMLMLDVGLRDETSANNGISHFVEHLLFAGSQRWTEQEIKEVIPAVGGNWNGYTTTEHTAYYAQVAARHFETALDWLVELVAHPVFTEATLKKEREVIFAEGWGRKNPLLSWLYDLGFGYDLTSAIHQQLFPNSALGMTVLGADTSLDAIDLVAVQHYYDEHYRPDAMVLVVVGAVDRETLERLVVRYLAGLPAADAPRAPHSSVTLAENGPMHTVIRGPFPTDQARIALGFGGVSRTDGDYWTLDLLAKLLEQRLERRLRHEQGLVYGVWVDNVVFRDTGYFSIRTDSERSNREQILRIVDEELEAIRTQGIEAAEFTLARNARIGQQELALEDNLARADYLAWWATALPPDAPAPDFRSALQSVTAGQLAAAIRTYAVPERRFLVEHLPIVTGASLPWLAAAGLLAGALVVVVIWRSRRRAPRAAAVDAAHTTPASQPPST